MILKELCEFSSWFCILDLDMQEAVNPGTEHSLSFSFIIMKTRIDFSLIYLSTKGRVGKGKGIKWIKESKESSKGYLSTMN